MKTAAWFAPKTANYNALNIAKTGASVFNISYISVGVRDRIFFSVHCFCIQRISIVMDFKLCLRIVGLVFFLHSPILNAAEEYTSPPESAGSVDEEELLDDSLKRFGYLAGPARGCVVEQQRADIEREALDLHAAIGRLPGTDRAFLVSASFGYGNSVEVETKDRAEVLKKLSRKSRAVPCGARGKPMMRT